MIKKKLHIKLHEELRSHFLYIAEYIQTITCLHSSFIVLELLCFLLFMCWACTIITINSTSPLQKQCDIP